MRFDWLWAQSDKIFNLFLWHSYLAIVPVVIGVNSGDPCRLGYSPPAIGQVGDR
ncbi:hypothetical protein LNO36_00540 [Klebsiella variicola subsp. variicola]|nr:hypothetical protein [Klebsiella variicola subsp. variicola]